MKSKEKAPKMVNYKQSISIEIMLRYIRICRGDFKQVDSDKEIKRMGRGLKVDMIGMPQ